MIIKRISPLSAGKVTAALYALLGLLIGGIFSLLSLVGAGLSHSLAQSTDSGAPAALVGVLIGAGSVIIFPIFYGIIGFIGGIISAALYNLCASVVGGMKLDIELQQPPQPAYATAAGV